MGKRKSTLATDKEMSANYMDEVDSEGHGSSSSPIPPPRKPKKTVPVKEEDEEDELESDQEDVPLAKKPKLVGKEQVKAEQKRNAIENGDILIRSNPDGEKYLDLGKKKRATVRNFKGTTFVDIREFYGSEGDEKPGKKGVSLGIEQWENLKRSVSTIDELFAELKK